jgi:hypothetical protein
MTEKPSKWQHEPCVVCGQLVRWPRGIIEEMSKTGSLHRVQVRCGEHDRGRDQRNIFEAENDGRAA